MGPSNGGAVWGCWIGLKGFSERQCLPWGSQDLSGLQYRHKAVGHSVEPKGEGAVWGFWEGFKDFEVQIY